MAKSYTKIYVKPPSSAARFAKRGLEARANATKSNKCCLTTREAGAQGIGSGIARARDIISGKRVNAVQVKAYFDRHRRNYEAAMARANRSTESIDKFAQKERAIQGWWIWGGDPMFKAAIKSIDKATRNPAGPDCNKIAKMNKNPEPISLISRIPVPEKYQHCWKHSGDSDGWHEYIFKYNPAYSLEVHRLSDAEIAQASEAMKKKSTRKSATWRESKIKSISRIQYLAAKKRLTSSWRGAVFYNYDLIKHLFANSRDSIFKEASDYLNCGTKLNHNPKSKSGFEIINPKKNPASVLPEWKKLINKCQKLWDTYYLKPTNKNLKAVIDHLEKMKESGSKKVQEERARCLRAVKKELNT